MSNHSTALLVAVCVAAGCSSEAPATRPAADAVPWVDDSGTPPPGGDSALEGGAGDGVVVPTDAVPSRQDAVAAGKDVGVGLPLDGGAPGTVITDDPKQPRVWPAAHGEALIALWRGDALAAMTLTIDDNTAPDHPFWIAQGKAFGVSLTWFIITSHVGKPYGGTWAGFAQLVALGHDVQSHTVSALQDGLTIDEEYRDSKKAIEANLPGVRALTLAYPGNASPVKNDPAVAAKYYIGARGGGGGHDNPVGSTNYLGVASVSGKFHLTTDHWAGIPNLITFNPARPKSYRAWHCIHFHRVNDTAAVITGLKYLQAHAADLWVGLFREVAQYGQEREAATLQVPHVSADRIVLLLTDTLDDSKFDHPLTLKVGLASHWKKATASQGGKPVPARIVQHGGEPFALVDALPDRGLVELTRH